VTSVEPQRLFERSSVEANSQEAEAHFAVEMSSRHLDIDQILSEEERIPCLFLYDAAGMGHLDSAMQQNVNNTLPEQSRVDLPFWLGQELLRFNSVQIELPKFYGNKMRDEMRAGAVAINLREFSFFFFEVGIRLAIVLKDRDLLQHLRQAFLGERYRKIMVRALSQGSQDDLADFSQTLTSSEIAIFRAGLIATQNLHAWRSLESTVLKGSRLLGARRGGGGGSDSHAAKKARS
jgi:GINS complex subunit 3